MGAGSVELGKLPGKVNNVSILNTGFATGSGAYSFSHSDWDMYGACGWIYEYKQKKVRKRRDSVLENSLFFLLFCLDDYDYLFVKRKLGNNRN